MVFPLFLEKSGAKNRKIIRVSSISGTYEGCAVLKPSVPLGMCTFVPDSAPKQTPYKIRPFGGLSEVRSETFVSVYCSV